MPVNSPYNQTQYSAGQPVSQPAGNRYIPPTFNYRNNNGSADYSTMNWNNVQGYDLPQQRNNPYTQQYMEGLRGSLSGFGSRYPRQTPTMPQFGQQGGYDPQRMMQQMYRGMSPEQMFGGGQRGGRQVQDESAVPGYGNQRGGRYMGDPRGGRQEAYDYARQQPWFDSENYSGGMGGMRGDSGQGAGYQDLISRFYEQMMARNSANTQVGSGWNSSGEGEVKPGGKIGYRG